MAHPTNFIIHHKPKEIFTLLPPYILRVYILGRTLKLVLHPTDSKSQHSAPLHTPFTKCSLVKHQQQQLDCGYHTVTLTALDLPSPLRPLLPPIPPAHPLAPLLLPPVPAPPVPTCLLETLSHALPPKPLPLRPATTHFYIRYHDTLAGNLVVKNSNQYVVAISATQPRQNKHIPFNTLSACNAPGVP